jgi:hypothetical protein
MGKEKTLLLFSFLCLAEDDFHDAVLLPASALVYLPAW